jgi:hypothetical protein
MPQKNFKYIFLGEVILWKNGIFSDFYVNKYGKLHVYGAIFVDIRRLGGLYDSRDQ